MARSVGDFDVFPVRRRTRRRGVALLAAVDLAVLASGAGFLLGQAGGGDKDAAILAGRGSGHQIGKKAGFEQGYAAGLQAGREAGERVSYRPAYKAAVRKARQP